MTRAAFCEERGIVLNSVGYWLNPASGSSAGHQKTKKHRTDSVPVSTISMGSQPVLRLRIADDLVAELDLSSDEAIMW